MTNYYENELYKVKLHNNKFKDIFNIDINKDNIIIKRLDATIGWGQQLEIIIRYKLLFVNEVIKVGNSEENIKIINFDTKYSSTKMHFENDKYKIFYISKDFDDSFKIDYIEDEKKILIKRLDDNSGWGQNLKLKCINKENNKIQIITIGSSNINNIKINFNIDNTNNLYKSENYIITIKEDNNQELFFINFYEENNTIYLKRIDSNEGWKNIIMLNIFDIKQNYNFSIYIGSSKTNDIYKKIELIIRKCYVSLTTIPTRIILPVFQENINNFLKMQTYPIENMFIVIANKYKRFTEKIPDEIINKLKQIPKVIVIVLDTDFGPASKYLGPLIHYYDMIKDNLLLIIDDDRTYNKNLIRNFTIGYNSNPNIIFSSGKWDEYFNKNYIKMNDETLEISIYKEHNDNVSFKYQSLAGFFGFCIKIDNMEKFINYNLKILDRIQLSIYHDEGVILGYLKRNEEIILYLNHIGCYMIKEELVDALCNSNLVNRKNIERDILRISNLENI